jgi:1-acyl-sn-glycerol-3-phosphate acyltransferase
MSVFGVDFGRGREKLSNLMTDASSTITGTLDPLFNADAPRPGFFARAFPSLVFYSRVAHMVLHAHHYIKAGRGCPKLYIESSLRLSKAANAIGARVLVENAEVLSRLNGPCIIAANHMSSFETMALHAVVMPFRPMTIIAKESLTKYPFFSTPLKACDPIIVGRTNPREDLRIMTTQAHDRITRGISIVVFPQTTRTSEFSPDHFNSIGAKLARREGVPLLPLALKTDLWGCGSLVKDLGKIDPKKDIRYRFGEPIDATNEREAHQKCVEFIGATLAEWRA